MRAIGPIRAHGGRGLRGRGLTPTGRSNDKSILTEIKPSMEIGKKRPAARRLSPRRPGGLSRMRAAQASNDAALPEVVSVPSTDDETVPMVVLPKRLVEDADPVGAVADAVDVLAGGTAIAPV